MVASVRESKFYQYKLGESGHCMHYTTTFPEHGIEYNIQILPSGENFGNHICNTDNVISLNKEIYCSNAMSEVTELKSFIYIYIFFYDYLGKM